MNQRLPESVQRAADEADRIQAEMFAPPKEPEASGDGGTAPVSGTPAPQPSVAPVETAPVAPDEVDVWKQRYVVLQGKYNAEVPRLAEQVKQLSEQLSKRTQDAAPTVPPTPVVTDQDKDAYGADLMDTVDRIVRTRMAEAKAELESRDSRIVELENRVSEVQVQTAEERFFGDMTSALPDWKAQNNDPRFLAWLAEDEPLVGVSRKTILDTHVQQKNALGAAKVFLAFRESMPKPTPTPTPNPLENQVAPSRAGASSLVPTDTTIVWTSQLIGKFYEDVRRGAYTPEQAAQLEADLMSAVSAGRVTP